MNNFKQISDFESNYGLIIPEQYKEFLKVNNGFSFDGGQILYSLNELKQMNDDWQIQKYQCNYIAIGDDGGGLVFLMKQELSAKEVICVDASDYDVELPFCRISNFDEWYKNGCKICTEEKESSSMQTQGNVVLVKEPRNGIKDLIKIKRIFNMDIPTSELLKLSKELPCTLIRDIKYAKAVKLIAQIGQEEIFEFRSKS